MRTLLTALFMTLATQVYAEKENWVSEGVSNFGDVFISTSGIVTHGDKLRLRFVKGKCRTPNIISSMYSMQDNPEILKLSDQFVNVNFADNEGIATLRYPRTFLNGVYVTVDLGWTDLDRFLDKADLVETIDLQLLDTKDFTSSDFFDIPFNSWGTDELRTAASEAVKMCENL